MPTNRAFKLLSALLLRMQMASMRPILNRLERVDLALALHDQPHSNRLHAPCHSPRRTLSQSSGEIW